jgi:hypothetical protein
MLTSKIEAGEENLLVLTKLFQNVNESNYLKFVKIANIQFNLPTSATVTLSIVDLNGKVVSSNTEKLNAGNNKFMFNTNMLSNGIYSVRLTSNEFVATQKLSVIK